MSKPPSHNIYVNVGGEGSKLKLKIGAAWAHENGDGFNISLNANPIDGKMVAFPVKDDEESTTVKKSGKTAKQS